MSPSLQGIAVRLLKRTKPGFLVLAVELLALLSACRSSPEAALQNISRLSREGKFKEALVEADRGLSTAPKDSLNYWEIRLRKAQILERSSAGDSLAVLREEPPSSQKYAPVRARFKVAQAYANLVLSRYTDAEQAAQEAEEISRNSNAVSTLASAELLHAQILAKARRLGEAETLARDGNRRALALNAVEFEAYGVNTLAKILTAQSRYEDALPYVERELVLREQLGDRAKLATCLITLGFCHSKLGDAERAMELYLRAGNIGADVLDRRSLNVALGNTGGIYLDRGDLKRARKYLEDALAMSDAQADIARWKSNLATLFIEAKDWRAAAALNDQALHLRKQLGEPIGYSLVNAARILDGQGDTAAAANLFSKVAHTEPDDKAPIVLALSGLARMYARLGKYDMADREFRSALQVVEQSRSTLQKEEHKLAFLSSEIEVHGEYIDFLMAQGKTEAALEVAEATRARLLQERTGNGEATHTVNAALYKRIAHDTGASLISYWLGPKRSYLWLTTPERIVAYPLPPQEKFRRLVESYREQIENQSNPLDDEDTTGADLYEALLGPISDRLLPGAHLIVAPDGALNALNLETLPVPGSVPRFLIEDVTISVVPSLNLLLQNPGPENHGGRILLIGNPDSSDDHFPKLPFAEREIQEISGHFDKDKVASFQKGAAVPAVYQTSDGAGYSYVHFTAHASANRELPLESAIVLSGQPGANRLTAGAVRDHHMNANIVVISACRSAGARTYAGEGLVGFMWAFFRAGARNIVAGLWDVSDESTPILMDELYRGLTHGVPAAQALRTAKLKVMRSNATFRLPYFWGPFQLYIQVVPGIPVRSDARSSDSGKVKGL